MTRIAQRAEFRLRPWQRYLSYGICVHAGHRDNHRVMIMPRQCRTRIHWQAWLTMARAAALPGLIDDDYPLYAYGDSSKGCHSLVAMT